MKRGIDSIRLCFVLGALAVAGCGDPLVQFAGNQNPDFQGMDMTDVDLAVAPVPDLSTPRDLLGMDMSVTPPDFSAPDMTGMDMTLPALDLGIADLLSLPLPDGLLPDLRLPDIGLSVPTDLLRLPDLGVLPDLGLGSLPDLGPVSLPDLELVSLPDLSNNADLIMADMVATTDFSTTPDLIGASVGPRCPALELDGVMAVMTAAPLAAYNPTSSLTVEAYVYPLKEGAEMIVAGHTADPAKGTASYYLGINAAGHAFFTLSTNGVLLNTATSTAVVALNKWTHLAGELDVTGVTLRLFVAGQPDGTQMVVGFANSIDNVPLHVGRYSSATPTMSPFDGFIDEVRFSSTARYSAAFVPASAFVNDGTTLALYHFNETMGQTASDASANANVGSLQLNAAFADAPACQ